jgi:CheY-like chemotaxis protein
MADALDVLVLDDRPEDAELVATELRRSGLDLTWNWADSEEKYLAALDGEIDLIIADFSMPGFGALPALQLLQNREIDIPFIVVTGVLSDDVAAEFVAMGADDCVLKDRLARLGPTVERILQARKTREEKRTAETALQISESRADELAEISRVISSAGDITEVFPHFANHVKKLITFDRIGIGVIDRERDVMVRRFTSGPGIAGIDVADVIPLEAFSSREELEQGRGLVFSVSDLAAMAGRHPRVGAGLAAGLKSTIMAAS